MLGSVGSTLRATVSYLQKGSLELSASYTEVPMQVIIASWRKLTQTFVYFDSGILVRFK
jgi:hypothetical protein